MTGTAYIHSASLSFFVFLSFPSSNMDYRNQRCGFVAKIFSPILWLLEVYRLQTRNCLFKESAFFAFFPKFIPPTRSQGPSVVKKTAEKVLIHQIFDQNSTLFSCSSSSLGRSTVAVLLNPQYFTESGDFSGVQTNTSYLIRAYFP